MKQEDSALMGAPLGFHLKGGYKPYSRKEKFWFEPKLATGVLRSKLVNVSTLAKQSENSFLKFSVEQVFLFYVLFLFGMSVNHVDVSLDSKLILYCMRTILV
jgi:hypothetical protein